MINDIMNALTVKLKETFGIKVYINQVPQNFEEPCFFVHVISTDKTQIVDKEWLRKTKQIQALQKNNFTILKNMKCRRIFSE